MTGLHANGLVAFIRGLIFRGRGCHSMLRRGLLGGECPPDDVDVVGHGGRGRGLGSSGGRRRLASWRRPVLVLVSFQNLTVGHVRLALSRGPCDMLLRSLGDIRNSGGSGRSRLVRDIVNASSQWRGDVTLGDGWGDAHLCKNRGIVCSTKGWREGWTSASFSRGIWDEGNRCWKAGVQKGEGGCCLAIQVPSRAGLTWYD